MGKVFFEGDPALPRLAALTLGVAFSHPAAVSYRDNFWFQNIVVLYADSSFIYLNGVRVNQDPSGLKLFNDTATEEDFDSRAK